MWWFLYCSPCFSGLEGVAAVFLTFQCYFQIILFLFPKPLQVFSAIQPPLSHVASFLRLWIPSAIINLDNANIHVDDTTHIVTPNLLEFSTDLVLTLFQLLCLVFNLIMSYNFIF